jgi:hypothetical protein
VTRNERVRAYVPRIDLDTITFEFGSSTISNSQMQALAALGQAMEAVLAERPDEVYLIEGHTDAVGSDYDNLILSDRRAEAVAVALSQNFDIPPENLVTEGYGRTVSQGRDAGSLTGKPARLGAAHHRTAAGRKPAAIGPLRNKSPGFGPGFFAPRTRFS